MGSYENSKQREFFYNGAETPRYFRTAPKPFQLIYSNTKHQTQTPNLAPYLKSKKPSVNPNSPSISPICALPIMPA